MSLDHLCKEGPAEVEDIEIPSNIIFIFTILLVTFYGTHNNVHFYLFGFITTVLYQTFQSGADLYGAIICWYLIIRFNCLQSQRIPSLDSAMSRARYNLQHASQQTKVPRLEIIFSSKLQLCFQTCGVIQHFSTPGIVTPDIVQTLPQVGKSDIYLEIVPISEPPQLYRDAQLQQFITSEACCTNFIN